MASLPFPAADLPTATDGYWYNGRLPETELRHICTDSRADNHHALFIPLSGERFDGHDFIPAAIANGAAAMILGESKLAEGIVPVIPALIVKDPLAAYQRIARYHRRRMQNLTVIGITGSSGKTSTKEILRAALCELSTPESVLVTEANTNNQVGVPLNLLKLTPRHRYAVIEMGTNHHGEIEPLSATAEPDMAIITVIGASHLEYFGCESEVAREKATIFNALHSNGTCILPEHSIGQEHLDRACAGHLTLSFGDSPACSMYAEPLETALRGGRFRLTSHAGGKSVIVEWSVPGRHQTRNAAAAAIVCEQLGFDLQAIAAALSKTVLPGMRSKITCRSGTDWVNDAYNANPESMKAGLEWLGEFANPAQTLLVLGDMRELGETAAACHDAVIREAQTALPGAEMVLIGTEMSRAAERLRPSNTLCFPDSAAAAETVQRLARTKRLVFLKASRGTHVEAVEPKEC